jgi:hypothetical protein
MLIVHCRACGRTSIIIIIIIIIMYVACFSCSTMVIHLPIEYYISTYWILYIYLLNIIYLPIEYYISTYWILYIYLLNIMYLPIEYYISFSILWLYNYIWRVWERAYTSWCFKWSDSSDQERYVQQYTKEFAAFFTL